MASSTGTGGVYGFNFGAIYRLYTQMYHVIFMVVSQVIPFVLLLHFLGCHD